MSLSKTNQLLFFVVVVVKEVQRSIGLPEFHIIVHLLQFYLGSLIPVLSAFPARN